MKDLHDIIIRPIVSEKSFDQQPNRTYVFLVQPNASKSQIRDALEGAFDVEIAEVRTLRRKGKLKRQGRTQGYTPAIKKAYVKLTEESKDMPYLNDLYQ